MAFPDIKKTKRWYGYSSEPDGWDKLGLVNPVPEKGYIEDYKHRLCGDRLHVGREDNRLGKVFRYCPRCMVVVTH